MTMTHRQIRFLSWIFVILWMVVLTLAFGEASACGVAKGGCGEWKYTPKKTPKVVIDKRKITNNTDRSNKATATGGNAQAGASASAGSSANAKSGDVLSNQIVETPIEPAPLLQPWADAPEPVTGKLYGTYSIPKAIRCNEKTYSNLHAGAGCPVNAVLLGTWQAKPTTNLHGAICDAVTRDLAQEGRTYLQITNWQGGRAWSLGGAIGRADIASDHSDGASIGAGLENATLQTKALVQATYCAAAELFNK